MGQFQQAIAELQEILLTQPSELQVLLTLAKTHLEFGRTQLIASFTARAETSFVDSIKVILAVVDSSPGFRRIAWKTAADALFELSRMAATLTDPAVVAAAVERIIPLVTCGTQDRLSALLSVQIQLEETSSAGLSGLLHEVTIRAYRYRNSLGFLDDAAAASGSYDLAVALWAYSHRMSSASKAEDFRKEAVAYMKDAISLDPLSNVYWHALGDLYFLSHPKVAQHAYIKALELDDKVRT